MRTRMGSIAGLVIAEEEAAGRARQAPPPRRGRPVRRCARWPVQIQNSTCERPFPGRPPAPDGARRLPRRARPTRRGRRPSVASVGAASRPDRYSHRGPGVSTRLRCPPLSSKQIPDVVHAALQRNRAPRSDPPNPRSPRAPDDAPPASPGPPPSWIDSLPRPWGQSRPPGSRLWLGYDISAIQDGKEADLARIADHRLEARAEDLLDVLDGQPARQQLGPHGIPEGGLRTPEDRASQGPRKGGRT